MSSHAGPGSNAIAPYQALLFDVFGTVVNWRDSIATEMQRLMQPHGIEKDWNQFALDWRALYQPAMQQIRAGNRGYVILDTLHRENLQQLVSSYGLDSLASAELEHINRCWHRLVPWPDSLPGLQRLHRHFTLAPLSNGNVALQVNLKRYTGLPWDAILGSEPARGYKPQPEVYLYSAALLGLEPAQCLMVAAHNSDLRQARDLGFATAYVNRPDEYGAAQTEDFRAEEPWTFITDSMIELADALGCP